MKLLLLCTMSALFLGACSAEGDAAKPGSESSAAAQSTSSSTPQTDPQAEGDGKLEEPGQVRTSFGAKATLLSVIRSDQEVEIADGVMVGITDIKLVRIEDIQEDYQHIYQMMNIQDSGHVIQFTYKITNNNDFTLGGIGNPAVVTSTNEQLDNTAVVTDAAYEIPSYASADGIHVQYKINDPNINSVTVQFDLFNVADYASIPSAPIVIRF